MTYQLGASSKRATAVLNTADEGLLASVNAVVDGQRAANGKAPIAAVTSVRLLAGVRAHVRDQRSLAGAPLAADGTDAVSYTHLTLPTNREV